MSSRKLGLNLVVFVAVAALFTGLWALYNRPVSAPDWPEQISGFSFSPFRIGQSPQENRYPTPEQIRSDLELLSERTDNIRTYSVEGTLADIPRLAEEFGLRVSLGVWISPDIERNEREIAKAIELANSSRSVVRVIVGNESLFREEVEPEELMGYLDRVRAAVKVPVTTAEQWHIWDKYPELGKHVDLIAAHVLPYWEFIPMEDSTQFVLDRAREMRKLFPKKPLLLAEVGWPSNGRTRGGAEADQAEQVGLASGGLPAVLSQTLRTLLQSRMQIGMEKYPLRYPDIDQLVFEPNADDSELFFTNLFSFSSRHRVCQLAYRNTLADLRKRAATLKPMLAAHGIRYNEDIVQDRNRSILAGLDVAPRMTETTARLRRALDDVDQLVSRHRAARHS